MEVLLDRLPEAKPHLLTTAVRNTDRERREGPASVLAA
jgi:hypothetical protein